MAPDGSFRTDPITSAVAAEARSHASAAASKVASLEEDVAHLLMVVEALWEIVKTEHDYDDSELLRRVAEIDLRDGKLDGRSPKKPAADCSHCGRKMMGRKPMCIYCGKPSIRDVFAR